MRQVYLRDAAVDIREEEAFKPLYTRLRSLGSDAQTILLCSRAIGEEKVDAALHFARFLAGWGHRVLLLDTDLRRSALLGKVARSREEMVGLTHFLAGQVQLQDIVCATDVPGLHLVCAGPSPANPTEQLGSRRFQRMLETLRSRYDYILMDTAPLGMVSDAAVAAQVCDCAVVVGREGRGEAQYAQSVLAQIEKGGCPVIGTLPGVSAYDGPTGGDGVEEIYSDSASQRGRSLKRETGEDESLAKKKKKKKLSQRPGTYIIGLLLVIAAALIGSLLYTRMIPGKILLVASGVLLLIIALLALMVWDFKKKGLFAGGTVLSLLMGAVMVLGIIAVLRGVSTLNTITTVNQQTSHIGVYVKAEDPAQNLGDLSDYEFGVLAHLDQDSVKKAAGDIRTAFGKEIPIEEFAGLTQLIDGLETGEVGAIIFNEAYLDTLEEVEGYADVGSRIREITSMTVVVEVENAEPTPTPAPKAKGEPFTVYISGVDSRSGLYSTSRSDVNILATFNPNTHQVLLVSTPRDYYVPLSISGGARDKLTHAGIYGVDVSMDTLEMLYGVDIDYYFKVSFGGFEDIVDALGGVTVNSEYAFSSSDGMYYYNEGENYLYGAAALAFARERYNLAGGDNQRGRNQMALIRGIINKGTSPDILTNYLSIMSAAEGSFETSVPYEMIASMVQEQLSSGGAWDVVSYNVTGEGDTQVPYSLGSPAYVMWPNESTVAEAKDLMARVYAGEVVSVP